MKDPLLFGEARSGRGTAQDRKSTRLNSSHITISYAVFCLKKKKHDLRQDIASHFLEAFHLGGSDNDMRQWREVGKPPYMVPSVARSNQEPQIFFNDTATTEIYTLSLHDALPI